MQSRPQLQAVAGPEPELRAVVAPNGWRFWLDATGDRCFRVVATYRIRGLECGCGGCRCVREPSSELSWPYQLCSIHQRGVAELAWRMGALDAPQG